MQPFCIFYHTMRSTHIPLNGDPWDNPEEGLSLRKRLFDSPIGKMRIRADEFLMYIGITLSSLLPVRFRFFEMVV